MTQLLALESFEQQQGTTAQATAEFEAGFQEGYAAARAAFDADKNTRDDAFIQAVSDIEFAQAEARAQILESLSPLFDAVSEKLLPNISYDSFGLLLIQTIYEAAQLDTAKLPTLHLHPSHRKTAENLAREHGLEVVIAEDPTLSLHAAWVGNRTTETYFDLDGLLIQTRTILSAISDANQRINANE